jgi:hypothetical protein
MSMKAIAKEVGASLSSVSRWVRDVELTEEQQTTLELQAFNGHVKGRAVNSAVRRSARVLAQEEGRQLAERREALHVAGCMLYWAEGAKDRNQIRFTNSDPEMARFFVKFLRTYFNLRDENIKITCNLFADHLERQREIEHFWLETLRLPQSSLCKSTVKRLFEVLEEETNQQASLRHVSRRRVKDPYRPEHLRCHSGVRGFRAGGLVGIEPRWPTRTKKIVTTES